MDSFDTPFTLGDFVIIGDTSCNSCGVITEIKGPKPSVIVVTTLSPHIPGYWADQQGNKLANYEDDAEWILEYDKVTIRTRKISYSYLRRLTIIPVEVVINTKYGALLHQKAIEIRNKLH